ncbi:MAG: tRNA glutamyl-Q(34) synthetase GluQRS [Planctomycetota bacterium]
MSGMISDSGSRGRTRLAPSPTGALHVGNARTFLINWALAKQHDWEIVLRVENLDTPRNRPGATEQAIEDLRWLGLDWDEGPSFQLDDLSPYENALKQLKDAGQTYPCPATRREIVAAASAPHLDDHELRYPGLYRPPVAPPIDPDAEVATRVIVPDGDVSFVDRLAGEQTHDVQQQVGDFVLSTKTGLPAYQLAVVVDDHRQGITDIVRGDDLLRSTARQIVLQRLLGIEPTPTYWHVPLVVDEDGRRMAKRRGDTRLASLREQGVSTERMVSLLARLSGWDDAPPEMSAAQFAEGFSLNQLSRRPVAFTQGDLAWLLQNNQ